MTMKMRLKKKNTSHKYDINRPMPRYGHEYTKYSLTAEYFIRKGYTPLIF